MSLLKLVFDTQRVEQNNYEELIQRCAWRLVRSARDRYKDGQGELKRNWATDALKRQFPILANGGDHEDYIRAAYEHYRAESKTEVYNA